MEDSIAVQMDDDSDDYCDHICTSNCRREGCNCDCGEWHEDQPAKVVNELTERD